MHVFSVASSIWPLKIVLLFVEVAQSQRADFFITINKKLCIRFRIDSSVF